MNTVKTTTEYRRSSISAPGGDRGARAALFGFAAAALLLVSGALMLTGLGTGAYRAVLSSRSDTYGRGTPLAYLRAQVRAHDEAGCVEVREGGDVLALLETDGVNVYETLIYSDGESLVEEYSAPGAGGGRVRIAGSAVFSAELMDGGLLRLTTGGGETFVKLFAAGEGGA